MKSKGYFVALTHIYVPVPSDPTRKQVEERCEFVTKITNTMITSATVILDAENRKFVKNRVGYATYEQFESHIEKTHPEKWKKFNDLLVKIGVTKAV